MKYICKHSSPKTIFY